MRHFSNLGIKIQNTLYYVKLVVIFPIATTFTRRWTILQNTIRNRWIEI